MAFRDEVHRRFHVGDVGGAAIRCERHVHRIPTHRREADHTPFTQRNRGQRIVTRQADKQTVAVRMEHRRGGRGTRRQAGTRGDGDAPTHQTSCQVHFREFVLAIHDHQNRAAPGQLDDAFGMMADFQRLDSATLAQVHDGNCPVGPIADKGPRAIGGEHHATGGSTDRNFRCDVARRAVQFDELAGEVRHGIDARPVGRRRHSHGKRTFRQNHLAFDLQDGHAHRNHPVAHGIGEEEPFRLRGERHADADRELLVEPDGLRDRPAVEVNAGEQRRVRHPRILEAISRHEQEPGLAFGADDHRKRLSGQFDLVPHGRSSRPFDSTQPPAMGPTFRNPAGTPGGRSAPAPTVATSAASTQVVGNCILFIQINSFCAQFAWPSHLGLAE